MQVILNNAGFKIQILVNVHIYLFSFWNACSVTLEESNR